MVAHVASRLAWVLFLAACAGPTAAPPDGGAPPGDGAAPPPPSPGPVEPAPPAPPPPSGPDGGAGAAPDGGSPAPSPSAPTAHEIIVTHGYRGILARDPDPGGRSAYLDFFARGGSLEGFCGALFESPEFQTRRAPLGPEALARGLYRGILERDPDPEGGAVTVAALEEGRGAVRAAEMLRSDEFQRRFLPGGGVPPPPAPADCSGDGAAVVSADLPAQIRCGWTYPSTVTLRNTGTTTWTRAGGYKLGTVGDSDPFFPATRVYLSEGASVPPGASHTFSVTLSAPLRAGTLTTDWRMVREGVCWFGGEARRDVTVECSAPTGRALAPVEVQGNVLAEPSTGWRGLGLGISLFYAPSIPREEYERVIDELAVAGIDFARFSGSTLSWGNEQGRPEVIPFRAGRHPYFPDDPEVGAWTPEPDPAFFDELEERLRYASARGVRVQYTVFWGAFRKMFVDGDRLRREPAKRFLRYAAQRLGAHPEHTIEIINEADHGHHMAVLGREARVAALGDMAGWVREVHPRAVLSVSDGGRQPSAEGEPYFDYHEISSLDYWNVHFPRDAVLAEGIPRWARGVWHLYGDRDQFAALHPGKGYGRNDENIFLQTEEDYALWPYRNSTRDWRMYANMMWVSTVAGVGFTLHSQKGFFAQPGLTADPIFAAIRGLRQITEAFPWAGARSTNTSWAGSPLRSFTGVFKAFALSSADRADILVHVLNPGTGSLEVEIDHDGMTATAYDPLTGRALQAIPVPRGTSTLRLPASPYEHGLTLRIRR